LANKVIGHHQQLKPSNILEDFRAALRVDCYCVTWPIPSVASISDDSILRTYSKPLIAQGFHFRFLVSISAAAAIVIGCRYVTSLVSRISFTLIK